MKPVLVHYKKAKYYRHHSASINNNEFLFDTADGEYGVGRIPLDKLKKKIQEYEEKNMAHK